MGEDTHGFVYPSVKSLWDKESRSLEDKERWYETSLSFWRRSEPSINGVLSGHSYLSDIDLEGSTLFLRLLRDNLGEASSEAFTYVLDCGAGIGRVTKHCLINFFQKCDLLEPVETLLSTAKTELEKFNQVNTFHLTSLQDFTPPNQLYSCFWLQWCVLYLTDDDLVACLKRFRKALKPNGFICVKENVILSSTSFYLDRDDNSLMRTDSHYRDLFKKAGLSVVWHLRQPNYPQGLIPVMMYCLS